LFLLIAAPWFILVARRNPEFNHFFWYDQHIGRFLGGTDSNAHVEGLAYYFKLLPLIFFPWSLFLPAALIGAWQARHAPESSRRRSAIFLLCGAGFILLFFSASSGKLLTYILPLVPLVALLLAAYFDGLFARRERWNGALTFGVVCLLVLLLAGGVAVLLKTPAVLLAREVAPDAARLPGVLLLAWAVALCVLAWRYRLAGAIAATAGGFALFFAGVLPLAAAIVPRFTTEALVERIRPGLQGRSEIVSIGYTQSVSFYTGRRVEIIDPPAEVALGVRQLPFVEREDWIFSGAGRLDDLKADLARNVPVYCFVRSSRRKAKLQTLLQKLGGQAIPIAANERFLVLGNRAASDLTPPQPMG
jgi:hypothetical protein